MNNLLNQTGSAQAWAAARLRLEDYLRGLRLAEISPREQERMVARLMERAAAEACHSPGSDPTWLLMKQFRAALERWFGQMDPACELGPQAGLINWFALEPAVSLPGIFLTEKIPADLQSRLQAHPVCPVPRLNLSYMVPLPLANPLLAVADLPVRFRKLAHEWGRKLAPGVAAVRAAIPVRGVHLR